MSNLLDRLLQESGYATSPRRDRWDFFGFFRPFYTRRCTYPGLMSELPEEETRGRMSYFTWMPQSFISTRTSVRPVQVLIHLSSQQLSHRVQVFYSDTTMTTIENVHLVVIMTPHPQKMDRVCAIHLTSNLPTSARETERSAVYRITDSSNTHGQGE